MFRFKYLFVTFSLMLCLLTGCSSGAPQQAGSGKAGDLKDEIRRLAGSYALSLTEWEVTNLLTPVKASGYMDNEVLARNIGTILKEQGLSQVPPVNIRLTKPPLLLVISPRDRISYFDRLLICPDLAENQVVGLEKQLDGLGLSSLVVEIGGFGAAYPAIVSSDMPVRQVVSAAVEEWSHQYLAVRPLGFLYLLDSLGFSQRPDVIDMNETLAGMMADEIGDEVYERYYRNGQANEAAGEPVRGFNFDGEMRETRRTADSLLAAGQVKAAEDYMENRCIIFRGYGYRIRKLNQAYFAFHGIYGQDPCATSPVYDDMRTLRSACRDLSSFVRDVSAMNNYDELRLAVARLKN